MLLFADDTKIYREINNVQDQQMIQKDIDNMILWTNDWLLRFHPDKCKHLRIGNKNDLSTNYYIDGTIINKTEKEKDLGIIIDDKLNFDAHIDTQVQKANSIMGLIRRTFTFLDGNIFTRLFKALVRPHLEYGHVVWHPSLIRQKKSIENVLRRATKMLPCCKDLSYKDRLLKLNIPCMIYRKLRGDLIEVFKMLNNHYDKDIKLPLKLSNRDTGNMRLVKSKITRDIRANFFGNRVVNFWNELPDTVKTAPSIPSFERRLDKFWNSFNIKYDFDKCLDFERTRTDPNYAGSGRRNTKINKIEDLELQELI